MVHALKHGDRRVKEDKLGIVREGTGWDFCLGVGRMGTKTKPGLYISSYFSMFYYSKEPI